MVLQHKKTFKKFSSLLKGRINTIHFLPFFPYSSDDGFSVIDYGMIKKEFGNWNDVKLVGKDFKLMFDFVLNHVSSKIKWFIKNPFLDSFASPSRFQAPFALPTAFQVQTVPGSTASE